LGIRLTYMVQPWNPLNFANIRAARRPAALFVRLF